ncbi:hypothetical protein ABID22_001644 [Pontibacter aydingkolensis]|uniref:Aspartyl protease n=1 Tax=Pontibacter aydingkolensis TaxID=1911536 RepID=A0ABS7CUG3_9BACT|nr:hypothetical protein [Pontibacter aydingkolensis]MBW7467311.1 hypothetical protein [Pontibacter aydingkolensis]
MKSTLWALLVLIPLSVLGQVPRESKLLPAKEWIAFQWEGSTLGNRYFDKAFMNVPFQIDSIPHRFKVQFDLGATNSMLYGNAIAPYLHAYPELATKLDTVNKPFRIQSRQNGSFKDVEVHLEKTTFRLKHLMYFEGFGVKLTSDSVSSPTIKHVGTLGASFFKNKVLVIDYPNHRLLVLDSLDSETEKRFDFSECRIDKGRVKLPFTIGAKTYWVMFDTGSSIFPLVTNKKYFKKLADGSVTDTLTVSSWGKSFPALGRKPKEPIRLGSTVLTQSKVYLMPNFNRFFKEERIIGLTGNALFLESVIAVDFKNGKFGILKE